MAQDDLLNVPSGKWAARQRRQAKRERQSQYLKKSPAPSVKASESSLKNSPKTAAPNSSATGATAPETTSSTRKPFYQEITHPELSLNDEKFLLGKIQLERCPSCYVKAIAHVKANKDGSHQYRVLCPHSSVGRSICEGDHPDCGDQFTPWFSSLVQARAVWNLARRLAK